MQKSDKKKFITNFGNLSISMIISSISSFFCFAVLGNKMSVEDYGQFSAVLALASSVAVFVNNVFASIVANREIAINPSASRDLLLTFFKARMLAFILSGAILSVYTYISGYHHLVVVSLIVILFVDSFFDLFEQIAFGLKVTKYSVVLNCLSSIAWTIVVAILPIKWISANVVLMFYGLIGIVKTFEHLRVDLKLTKQFAGVRSNLTKKYLLFSSLPYLYNRFLGIISAQLPVLLLDGYAGLSQTAYYSVGEKFTTPISKLTMVLISAAFPFITTAFNERKEKMGAIILGSFQLVLSFGACLCLLLCSISDWSLVTILGEKYLNAAEAFNYQIWFTIVLAVDSIFSMVLSADFKQKTLSVITTIDALTLIPFLYFGIGYGAKGIALAKLIYSTACLLYHIFIATKYWGNRGGCVRSVLAWCLFAMSACLCVFYPVRLAMIAAAVLVFSLAILLNFPVLRKLLRRISVN